MKIWKKIKLLRKIVLRFSNDIISGQFLKFAKKRNEILRFSHNISINQEIKKNETYESKMYNFSLAADKVNEVIIYPNEIFSFWRVIGNPNYQFKKGRTIQNGEIVEDVGGGLCQVSGIIYYVSLVAGLDILERFNHSTDIYNDETRFCPLGTDATIVYGYKDLRLRNKFSFPIRFKIEIADQLISIKLFSVEPINENELFFEVNESNDNTTLIIRNKFNETVNISNYKKLNAA
jgi:vancomycin resistance protein VanW